MDVHGGSFVRALALALAVTGAGCADDGAAPTDSDSSTSEPSTSGTPDTSNPSTSGPTTSGPTSDDPDSTSATSTGESTTDDASSTGDPNLCGITDDPDQTGAWFEMRNGNTVVVDGGTIALECGGQGTLMFYLRTTQGGFVPEGETAYYAVTLDVPGFDDLTPSGHFFQDLAVGVDVGCAAADEFEGGFSLDGVAVFLPDALLEPSIVDGLPATLHVELEVPGGEPIVLDAGLTLEIDPALTIESCGFG
jgi:hypothetical protein